MRRSMRWFGWLFLLGVIGASPLQALLNLGSATLTVEAAPPMLEATHLQFAMTNQRYLYAVGGVAFDQVAESGTSARYRGIRRRSAGRR